MSNNAKMGTKTSCRQRPGVPTDNPQSQYLKIAPSTRRYKELMALAQEYDCSWQQIARAAIDWYLHKNPPKQI